MYAYRSSLNPEETLDALASGRLDAGELIRSNDPILGWNGQEVTSRIRPTDKEVANFGLKLQQAWYRNYKPFIDRPLVHITLIPG
jgi:alcohol oxidase